MNQLHILSYNIWFEETMEEERVVALINIINKYKPDIICLQEVKQNIFNILISKLDEYSYNYYPKRIVASYGCVIFSKYNIAKCLTIPFQNSMMGRSLIISKIDFPYFDEKDTSVNKIEIVIVTTHFESIFSRKRENTVKLEQFKTAHQILNKLYKDYENVIFCVDTNIITGEEDRFIPTSSKHYELNKQNEVDDSNLEEQILCLDVWYDAWSDMGDATNRYTYDSYTNMHLKKNKFKYRSRLDRVLYKCNNCILTQFDTIKNNILEPSDHYGITTKFEIISN